MKPDPRRWSLVVALVFLVIGISGLVVLLFYGQLLVFQGGGSRAVGPAGVQQAVRATEERWLKERAKLFMDREELTLQLEQATGQVAQLEQERTNLLDRMKALLKERNEAREEVNRLRQDLVTVGTTMAQLTDEAARLKEEIARLKASGAGPPVISRAQLQDEVKRQVEQERKAAEARLSQELTKVQDRFAGALRRKDEALERANAELTKVKAALAKAEEQLKGVMKEHDQLKARLRKEVLQAREALERQTTELAEAQKKALRQQEADLKRGFSQTETALTLQLQQAQADLRKAQASRETNRIELEQLRAELTQDWAKLYVRVGLLEIAQGRMAEAEAAFKQAIALQPSMGVAHYNLGVLYDDYLNQPAAAAREYEQYLLLTPQAKDAATVRGWVQALKAQHTSEAQRQAWNRGSPSGVGKTLKQIFQ